MNCFKHFLITFLVAIYFSVGEASAQDLALQEPQLPQRELSVNLFRNPSIGLEYRQQFISVHLGYYPTNFESNETTSFVRAGISFWYLPARIGGESASSFYSGVSYLYGFGRDYKNKSALIIETGFRWVIWRGLNIRLGISALAAPELVLRVAPNPGIGWAFFF